MTDAGGASGTAGARPRRAPLRRDARATREVLLAAAGALIAARGQTFGLPDVARESGVGMATVYRHFADVPQLLDEYQTRVITDLTGALRAVPRDVDATERFGLMCARWVDKVDEWGSAAVRIRSHLGVLERLRLGDSRMEQLYATLEPVIRALISERRIPSQPLDYAVLMWATIFDERVILELRHELGWSKRATSQRLAGSVLASLAAAAPAP